MARTHNPASQWRLAVAGQIAPRYAAYANVAAVVVLGGVARGWADHYSDIDLVVYWNVPPTEAERRAVIEQSSGVLWHLDDTLTTEADPTLRYWWEDFHIAGDHSTGLKIDIGHHLAADMDAIIEAVTQHFDPHPLKHEMLYSIKRGHTFYGHERVAAWARAAGVCPEQLVQRFVEENLRLNPFWFAAACVERGDWVQYNRVVTQFSLAMVKAVAAINREYYQGVKRQEETLNELPIQPPDFNERLNLITRGDPSQAIAAAYALDDEVLTLAQRHVPQANLDGARDWFHYQRPQWRDIPAGLGYTPSNN